MPIETSKSGRQARFFFAWFSPRRGAALFAAMAFIGMAMLLYALMVEPRWLAVRKVDVPVPEWTGPPMTVVFVSDIHMGGMHTGPDRIGGLVETITAQNPDIILISGDFTNGNAHRRQRTDAERAEMTRGFDILSQLSAPHGVYFVPGNHDYEYGLRDVKGALEFGGLVDATHQAIIIDSRVCLFGVDDEWYGAPNPDAYYNCPVGMTSLALLHNPDGFTRLDDGVDLRLAGHTHGGQVNLPIFGRVVTATKAGKKWAYGLIEQPLSYVTAGYGTSGMPIRFRARPEIAVLTLSAPKP